MHLSSSTPAPSADVPAGSDAAAVQHELVRLYGQLYRRALARERAGGELVRSDFAVLKHLAATGACRAQTLAAEQGADPSTMSRRVAGLLDRGFVDRAPDPADGRAHVLSITAEGRAALQREKAARTAELQAALAGWGEADLAELTRLLHELNRSLEADQGGLR